MILYKDRPRPYKLARIFGPTAHNADLVAPLARPDVSVTEGDFLVAIDGHALKAGDNPYQFLQVTRGQKVSISVGAKPFTFPPVPKYPIR